MTLGGCVCKYTNYEKWGFCGHFIDNIHNNMDYIVKIWFGIIMLCI